MRKVLSFVLVLSLILGSFGTAFAATPAKSASDIAGKDCEQAVNVLMGLDVVSGYEDGTYKPESIVTRAEMAALIVKALGLNDYAVGTPKFADSKTHWAKGYIAYANSLGIISGRTATAFDPDATVTYDEAATMLVKALGYEDATLVGTWPTNYVTKAKVLGILDGVKSGTAGANRGDVAVMLYQTLDQAIGKVNKDGDWVGTATKFNDKGVATEFDTMLARLGAKIYDKTDFFNKDDQNFVVTGDEDSVINLAPYKGALISAYMNDDKDIIAIKEVFSTFVSGSIDDDGIGDYTLNSDALADLKDAVKFDNGDNVSSKNFDDVNRDDKVDYTLGAKISGKKITAVYSVAKWTVNDADVLDSADLKDIDSNHKLLGISFDEDNDDNIDLTSFELIGAASLSDIKADTVAYVYKNKDSNISRIAVGPVDYITGEVTTLNSSGSKVTIDGKTYKFAKEELAGNGAPGKAGRGDIKAGDDVKLTMDAYGFIYDTEKTGGKADKYAVVLSFENEEPNKIDTDARIKLFLADGTNKVFTADEDEIANAILKVVEVNGEKVAQWQAPIKVGALVKYGLDKSGTITSMFAIDDEREYLQFVTIGAPGKSISSKGYFDGKTISKNAVLFNYTDVKFGEAGMSGKAGDYELAVYDKILDTDDVVATYVRDTDRNEIVAMLLNNATSSKDVYGVINSLGTNNSDAGAYYNMLIDGKSVKYNGDDSDKMLGTTKAAIYRVKFDSNGDIKSFENWFNAKDEQIMASTGDINDAKDASLDNRTFTKKDMTVETHKGETVTTGKTDSITLDRDAVIYRWDKNDKEWQLGSTSDLRSLEKGYSAEFYDVVDEDGIYDIALVYQVKTSSSTPTPTVSDKIVVSADGATVTAAAIDLNGKFVEEVRLASGEKLTVKTDYTMTGDAKSINLTVAGAAKVVPDAGDKGYIVLVLDDNTKVNVYVERDKAPAPAPVE